MIRTVWPCDANRPQWEDRVAKGIAERDGAGYRMKVKEGEDG